MCPVTYYWVAMETSAHVRFHARTHVLSLRGFMHIKTRLKFPIKLQACLDRLTQRPKRILPL